MTKPRVDLLVIGDRAAARTLARRLPPDWAVRRVPAVPDAVVAADLMLLFAASGPAVAAAIRRQPGLPVVGVVSRSDPVDVIVAVLEAGADACVREGAPDVMVSHLRACARRRRPALLSA